MTAERPPFSPKTPDIKKLPLLRDLNNEIILFFCGALFSQEMPLQRILDHIENNVQTGRALHPEARAAALTAEVGKYFKETFLDKYDAAAGAPEAPLLTELEIDQLVTEAIKICWSVYEPLVKENDITQGVVRAILKTALMELEKLKKDQGLPREITTRLLARIDLLSFNDPTATHLY